MKGRNAQVSRIYLLLNILEGAPQGLSVSELNDRLKDPGYDVQNRTVYRDLNLLRQSGFPLDEKGKNEQQGMRWVLATKSKVHHTLVLSTDEMQALYFGKAIFSKFKAAPFYKHMESAFDKILVKLGRPSQKFISELKDEMHVETNTLWAKGISQEVMSNLQAACSERQVVEIDYFSNQKNQRRRRKVGPHYLYFFQGTFYLVAEDLEDQVVKVFSLARVYQADMLDEPYNGEITRPEQFFQHSIGVFRAKDAETVRMRFKGEFVRYISERQWHPSQQILETSDGAVELVLQVGITPDFMGWVMSFGSHVTVLEPKHLALQINKEAKAITESYRLLEKKAS